MSGYAKTHATDLLWCLTVSLPAKKIVVKIAEKHTKTTLNQAKITIGRINAGAYKIPTHEEANDTGNKSPQKYESNQCQHVYVMWPYRIRRNRTVYPRIRNDPSYRPCSIYRKSRQHYHVDSKAIFTIENPYS